MKAANTLILSGRDVRRLVTPGDALAAVEEAFRLRAEGRALPATHLSIPLEGGGFHVKASGWTRGRTWVAAKINANFPANPERFGLPTIQGVVVLADGERGTPLAVMDSIAITLLRTAAATALAARLLAREDAATATICGCGVQGRAHAEALAGVRRISRLFLFDTQAESARALAETLHHRLGFQAEPVADLAAAVRASDIVVTCTPARRPFLVPEMLVPGAFVAAVGADSPDKQELDPRLLGASRVVVDDLPQCAAFGELNHALRAGVMAEGDIAAELHEVVAGTKPGRLAEDETIIFDSTGIGLQDVALATVAYERALRAGAGTAVSLSPVE